MIATRAAVTIFGLLLASCSGAPAPSPSPADADPGRPLPSPVPEVVARVNGQPIRIGQILAIAKSELDRVSVADRDRKKPEVLRRALGQYVDRELLLQEALARGIRADSRQVDWAYDQMRREHADDSAWKEYLAELGMDPQSFKAELRAQHTVAALLEQEVEALRVPQGGAEATGPEGQRQAVHDALLGRLRGRARIELLL
jgi:hypothetical protein